MATNARLVARTDDLEIVDNEPEHRYEAWLDGEQAGVIEYLPEDGWLVFDHTEVGENVEGRGVGSRLVKAALDDVRTRGVLIESRCPFVSAYLKRHPEYGDVVRVGAGGS
jgi:uncharacterized protein